MNTKLRNIFILSIILYLILLCFDYTHFDGISEEEDKQIPTFLLNRFYYCLEFITTTGFGDITSKSKILRFIISICHIMLLIIMFK